MRVPISPAGWQDCHHNGVLSVLGIFFFVYLADTSQTASNPFFRADSNRP
jgi:hypothetical protein